jgi:hypothetical protein
MWDGFQRFQPVKVTKTTTCGIGFQPVKVKKTSTNWELRLTIENQTPACQPVHWGSRGTYQLLYALGFPLAQKKALAFAFKHQSLEFLRY